MYTDWSEEDRARQSKRHGGVYQKEAAITTIEQSQTNGFSLYRLGGDSFWGFDKNYFLLFKPFKGVQQERDKDFKA